MRGGGNDDNPLENCDRSEPSQKQKMNETYGIDKQIPIENCRQARFRHGVIIMNNRPTKELVREWLRQRSSHPAPLPNIEQIQHQLGWKLVKN